MSESEREALQGALDNADHDIAALARWDKHTVPGGFHVRLSDVLAIMANLRAALSPGPEPLQDAIAADLDAMDDWLASPGPEPVAGLDVWATDLTQAEEDRLAKALRQVDYANWSAAEVAARIAGTVRAIAAARLSEPTP